MAMRIALLAINGEDQEAAERFSYRDQVPVIKILVNGQPRWGVLEETYRETSAEGPSWKPVEVY